MRQGPNFKHKRVATLCHGKKNKHKISTRFNGINISRLSKEKQEMQQLYNFKQTVTFPSKNSL